MEIYCLKQRTSCAFPPYVIAARWSSGELERMANEASGLKIVENPQRGEIFADEAVSFSLVNGVVRVTLTAIRPLPGADQSAHVVIGRLAMPLSGAQALAMKLYDFLKAQGAITHEGKTQ
jgi:hypothetical protein